jgi:hypothetical protein
MRLRERAGIALIHRDHSVLPASTDIGSIHTAGAAGFDGLCRQNAIFERGPPSAP